MEYLSKSEVIEYLRGKQKEKLLQGEKGTTIDEIIRYLNTMYSYRPSLQAQWLKKRETIECSRCGFRTLPYKNTKYCPECGRSMANGKAVSER